MSASGFSGQLLAKRFTKSGLLMKGRPKAIRTAGSWSIAFSAVSRVYPQLPIIGPLKDFADICQGHGLAQFMEPKCQTVHNMQVSQAKLVELLEPHK